MSQLLKPLCGEVEIVTIKTSGDRGDRDQVGAFVKEIQEALLDDRIDVALHCLKDLPTQPVKGLTFAAYLQREDPRDTILCRIPWQDLRQGAIIGTGSLRRSAQLAAARPDFTFKPLVGNVDTRLRKLMEGEYDAIVLAIAGLNRLGLTETWDSSPYAGASIQPLDLTVMVPAPGQAVLILECSETKQDLIERIAPIDHADTRLASLAERTFLSAFGGGCSLPVAALASAQQGIRLYGLVASPDGKQVLRGTVSGIDPIEVGRNLAGQLIDKGALGLFQTISKTGGN